ncbi:MAG: hypothetical protein HY540_03230 [Deltaproteobacteria bacterium]|nr:hypothetical protein [Deltaproteobacteria bacterium]
MKKTVFLLALSIAIAGCGGSSGGGSSSTVNATSVSSIPNMDLSGYDKSASTTNSISVPTTKGAAGHIGSKSRAFCEANIQKNEAIRMSKQIQLDKCYALAMEKGGLYSLEVGKRTLVKIVMPDNFEEFEGEGERGGGGEGGRRGQQSLTVSNDVSKEGGRAKPGEEEHEKRDCQNEKGALGKVMLMNIYPRTETELQIRMCQGTAGSEALINETTFSISGDVGTVEAIHKGSFCGQTEGGKFSLRISGIKSITDGVVDLASSGKVEATGFMDSSFGGGYNSFTYEALPDLNRVCGAFKAKFKDDRGSNSFTNSMCSEFGGSSNTGTAKFTFTGSFPAMTACEICSRGGLSQFAEGCYQQMTQDVGELVNAANCSTKFICPDVDESTHEFRGQKLATNGLCDQSNGGTESFVIATSDSNPIGTVIPKKQSAYFSTVDAMDLIPVRAQLDNISVDFTSSSEEACSGTPDVTINPKEFESMGKAASLAGKALNLEALQSAIATCQALDEELRQHQGMGGYDCHREDAEEELSHEAGADSGPSDDAKAFIPGPCLGPPVLTPDECEQTCRDNPECRPTNGGDFDMPKACKDAGQTPETCPDYCHNNRC